MLFNSRDFLLFFLPITFTAYHLSPPKIRLFVLIIASFIFYALSGVVPFIFLVASVLWAYVCALLLQTRINKGLSLLVAVVFPAWVLFMFRYLGFTLGTLNLSHLSVHFEFFLLVALPAGISFYTFQIISYSIDVHDGRLKPEKNLAKLTAYISFFPQLIAGPILRYEQISSQLDRVRSERWLKIDYATSFRLIAFGLFFKVFVADMFGVYGDTYNKLDAPSALDNGFLVLSYSLRIYFDFWSYSIIAIGLGKLFGIDLPRNFLEPYLSKNPKEFWRRWHVTLSYWLRDYVYIKLGGNHRYVRNIIIVFALVGLWHGAGWNFVAWGLYHAFLVSLYALTAPAWDKLYSPLQVLLTFLLVSTGWPLFFLDVDAYINILFSFFNASNWGVTVFNMRAWVLLTLAMIFVFATREEKWLFNPQGFFRFTQSPILHAFILFGALSFTAWARTFIYFRF